VSIDLDSVLHFFGGVSHCDGNEVRTVRHVGLPVGLVAVELTLAAHTPRTFSVGGEHDEVRKKGVFLLRSMSSFADHKSRPTILEISVGVKGFSVVYHETIGTGVFGSEADLEVEVACLAAKSCWEVSHGSSGPLLGD
jgi:hypothetical protein